VGKKGKGKKGKPLTGLAAALVKSGHLSEKTAKKITREQRREDKALGREAVAEREAEKQRQAEAERAAEAAAAREREAGKLADEALLRVHRLILSKQLSGPGGGRRWFFAARDGRVLFLDLADDVAGLLANGGAGIVEGAGVGSAEHVVVAGETTLEALRAIDADLVRFWNKP
jgi:hypothetical protein